MRRALAALAAAAALVPVAAGCGGVDSGPGSAPVAYRAEAFGTGAAVSTADLRGHPVLMTSWASWCAECRTELPAVEAYWKRRRGDGLRVVAVDIDGGGAEFDARRMAGRAGLTMPIWRDPENDFSARFGAIGVPTSVLLDRTGRLVKVWQGPIDFGDADTARVLDDAIAAPPG